MSRKIRGTATFTIEVPFQVDVSEGSVWEGWTEDNVDNELFGMTRDIEDSFPIHPEWMVRVLDAQYGGSEWVDEHD